MNELDLLYNLLTVGAVLFGLGAVGFLSRRNLIVMFLSVEMMLQGVSVSLVAWGRFHNDWGGQVLTIFVLTVAACEAALALALVMMLFRRTGTLDVTRLAELREENLPVYVDQEIPELPSQPEPAWPQLTPAGLRPAADPQQELYRSHV